MMMLRRGVGTPGSGKQKHIRVGIIAWISLICLCVLLRIRLLRVMEQQTKMLLSQSMAQIMLDTLSQMGISYEDLVHIERNLAGEVTSIETNAIRVGEFKSRMELAAVSYYSGEQHKSFNVHLGTLLGWEWMFGSGPNLHFRIRPIGYFQTEILHSFSNAGINQTMHRMTLEVCCDVETMIPFLRSCKSYRNTFPLTETILLGRVPEYYTDVSDASPEIASDLEKVQIQPIDAGN